MFYNKKGEEIELEEWGKLMDNKKYARVGRNQVTDPRGKEHLVSTVWTGLTIFPQQKSIFETMIFCLHDDLECALDQMQWRYSSEEEAKIGHNRVMVAVQEGTLLNALQNVE